MEMEQASFTELLRQEGDRIEAEGNRPFLLSDADSAWWVESGRIELFSVAVRGGEPSGRRQHFCSIEAGGGLFGMDMESHEGGRGLLAVGAAGTRLLRLPRSRLREAAVHPETARQVADMVDGWIMALSRGASQDINPRTDVMVEAGQVIALEGFQNVHARKGVVWLEVQEAEPLFLGMEEVSSEPSMRCFPITRDSWLAAGRNCRLAFHPTRDLIAGPAFWEDLACFHQIILRCEATNRLLAVADELNRLRESHENEQRAHREAHALLSTILVGDEAGIEARAADDHLLAACMLVGNAMEIDIRPHPDSRRGRVSRDPLGDIARASRVRMRRVQLKGSWWRSDTGPLVAFRRETAAPVALLPASPGAVAMRDPAKKETRLVDGRAAEELEPYAYAFYRGLPERPLDGADILQFTLKHVGKELRGVLFLGLLCGLISALIPLSVRYVVDTIVPSGAVGLLHTMALVLASSIIAGTLFEISRNIALMRVEGKTDAALQPAVMDRLLRLPLSFFKEYSAGDLAERALSIALIRQRLSGTTVISLLGIVFAVFHFIVLFYFDYRLAMAVAGLTAAAGCVNILGAMRQIRHLRPAIEMEGKITGMLFQFISGISKLRVAGAEAHAFASWARDFTRQRTWMIKSRRLANGLATLNSSLAFIILPVLFALVSLPLFRDLTAGDFIAFNTAMFTFVASMLVTSTSLASILNIIPLWDRVKPLLATVPERAETRADPGWLSGAVEVNDLSFRYSPDAPLVLDSVSFSVRPGEFVAFVGPSGSGKSTLLRMLLGFEAPDAGTVSYDGRDLAALDVEAVRRQIGVVLQNGELVPGDVYSNITGSLPMTHEEAWEAARLAGLAEEIEKLPMGMSTVVSAGGATFSGGQKQRLLIARALAAKPRILFLDEATSALDNKSQAMVSANLGGLQATRLVIAHRLSTVIHADCIHVLEAGRIIQSGTFEELMRQEGLFSELAARQLTGDTP